MIAVGGTARFMTQNLPDQKMIAIPSEQVLLAIYRQDPCRTLPNAFWKSANRLDVGSLDIRNDPGGDLRSLTIYSGGGCLAFWCANPLEMAIPSGRLKELEFALVHDQCLAAFDEAPFQQRRPFFRLRSGGPAAHQACPPGFFFRDVHPETEIDLVSSFILRCYGHVNVSPQIVRGWLAHPVYDPSLWVWIVDAATDQKAGLGMAELDPRVPEASLEWIQVLPEYQNRGLGTAVVAELLHRIEGRAAFTTVSGEMDHPKDPERVYRKCGFTGSDIWWFLAP